MPVSAWISIGPRAHGVWYNSHESPGEETIMVDQLADGRTDLVFDPLASGGSALEACLGVSLL